MSKKISSASPHDERNNDVGTTHARYNGQKMRLMTDGGNPTNDMSLFTSSETDEWATPPDFLRPLAEAVGGFDLDAAAGAEESPIAESVYTEADDGLVQPWFGTVWVNPPYSGMKEWTDKVVSELYRDDVDTILYLCKGDTSTDWWHTALAEASAIGMIDHRLSFGEDPNSAPFASHVFAFGDVNDTVLNTLNQQGAVFTTDHIHEKTAQTKLIDDE
ncbi:DNA N-6-adenine-methyltransferase [Halopenitus salinus]|uniref:DNA N-6-adenine-methyltransferase n=1 Tax=Halopenitus salinus TaxID=1198295 RepID=A0ABD5UU36_9EURY